MSITRRLALAAFIASGVMPLAANAGTFTTLYSFQGGSKGSLPTGPLLYLNGEVYGTIPAYHGYPGAVYKVSAKTGKYKVVYEFEGGSDGFAPEAGVTYSNGLLYGTTWEGGGTGCVVLGVTDGCGTIFSIDPSTDAETVLYEFSQDPNSNPTWAGAFVDLNGTLFAPTETGGVDSNGSVISLDPSTNTVSTLYSFTGSTDGLNPNLELLLQDGLLYGTTEYGGKGCKVFHGCGVVFSVNPSTGAETVVHAFGSQAGGHIPYSNLAYQAKSLVGDTSIGGDRQNFKRGSGVSFAIKAATGHEKVLETFTTGQQQYSGITIIGGSAYEVLPSGGTGSGELLQVDLRTGQQTVLYAFTGGTDGSEPTAPVMYHDGAFYGTTFGGKGTVYKYVP
jgi:uncharacterized repeat protein (TIGR03803 family)